MSRKRIFFAYFRTTAFLKLRGQFLISAEWSKQKEIGINLAEMTITELDANFMPRPVTRRQKITAEQRYSLSEMALKDFLIHLPTTVVFPSLKTPSLFSPTRCWTQKQNS